MNELEQWVEERSQVTGAGYTLLRVLAKRADGCVAKYRPEQLTRGARISRPQLYRLLAQAENLGEIQRVREVVGNKRVPSVHFDKYCSLMGTRVFHPLCPRKQSAVSDLRRSSLMSLTPLLNFPAAIVSQDECEECRGTGYRMVARPDGAAGQIAVRCAHKIAAIAGKWQTVATWQDGFLGLWR